MRNNKLNKIFREIIGSLLKSDLTDRELLELSKDILDHGEIIQNVALQIINIINTEIRDESNFRFSNDVQKEAINAYNWLKAKGVTKATLFNALSSYNRNMRKYIIQEKPTIKEAMEYFIFMVSEKEFHSFMNLFNEDDFIKIIEEQ